MSAVVPWNFARKLTRRRPAGCSPLGWIENDNGCHLWTGPRDGKGYASVTHAGKVRLVHRVRYEQEVGQIPDGLVLDHLCDNGAGGCCNPLHCRPVSMRENTLRGRGPTARNAAATHCIHGHPLSGANLYVYKRPTGRTMRKCRECDRRRAAEAKARSRT